jgi:hypothetical protein
MAVSKKDVAAEDINRRPITGELHYTSEACHTLLMWAWTRQPDQIIWMEDAEEMVYRLAIDMGARYVEDPPLVQAANVRVKIARLSAALAARTFSTDEDCEKVIITEDHVEDAVKFMDMIYGMPAFGYVERSNERIRNAARAREFRGDVRMFLNSRPNLVKLLRDTGRFRRQDIEEVLGLDRNDANAIINTLHNKGMLRKDGPDNVVEPTLHELLREERR